MRLARAAHFSMVVPVMAVAITTSIFGLAGTAHAACPERTKFVYEPYHTTAYGENGWKYPLGLNSGIQTGCGAVARTIHMHIGPSTVDDFVETGYYIGPWGGAGGNESFMAEADIYPNYQHNNVWLHLEGWDEWGCSGPNGTGFRILPYGGSTSYRFATMRWCDGSDTKWYTIALLPYAFYYNYGMNLSELSLTDYSPNMVISDPSIDTRFWLLKYWNGSSWVAWQDLWCATLNTPNFSYANYVFDYDAHALSTTSWNTSYNAPPAGDC
jgi:hypothetical protein